MIKRLLKSLFVPEETDEKFYAHHLVQLQLSGYASEEISPFMIEEYAEAIGV